MAAGANPLPYAAEIENIRSSIPGDAGEDFRVVAEALIGAIQTIAPNTLRGASPGATPSAAAPAGTSIRVTGANGVFSIEVGDGNQNGRQVWKEISYSTVKGFTSNVTILPLTTATSTTLNAPGATYFFRMRTSFDQVNWSGYELASVDAVAAGLVSSSATAAGAAFNQTNFGVVTSRAAGATADVIISGANGPLTSLPAIKGSTVSLLPAAAVSNVPAGSTQFVAWDGARYQLRPTLASVLADNLTPIGKVSVVSTAAPTLPVIHPIIAGGGVVGFNVVSGGAGAAEPYTLTITDPGGPGGGATAGAQTIVAGVLLSVAPGNAGANYDGNTIVTPSGGSGGGEPGGGTALGGNGGRLTAV